ncbi:MAG: glycoside hydrolase family 13 [Desulfobulbaceae bacterium]|nr:glycoside hydrolase family 13 [Desulfobulbaceae bacterium]
MASPSRKSAKSQTPATSKIKPAPKAAIPAKTAPIPTASTKTTPKSSERPSTEFSLFAPEAKEVLLTGEFCNWDGEGCRMRRFKDGSWKKSLKLKPGRYEYRFVVDGHWWTDPENPERQQNPFGQDNSVLIIP